MQHSKLFKKRSGKIRFNSSSVFRSNLFVSHRENCEPCTKRISTTIGAESPTLLSRINYFSPIDVSPLKQLVIGFFFASLLIACENDMKEVESFANKNSPLLDSGENVEILYSEEGKVKARIQAPLLIKDNTAKPFTEFPKGIKVEILDNNKKPVSVLTANYGKRYDKSEETIVQNDVVVTNKKGDRLETEELIRNDKTGELYTDAFVKITTATEVILGMGLKANEDFSWHRIDSVHGDININKNSFSQD